MTKVVADITMSLDGFVTGPDAGPQNGLGTGGELLHEWVFAGDSVDEDILREATEASGAVVMGRRLFDVVDGPDGWNDDMGYGAKHAGDAAVLRRHPYRGRRRSGSACGSPSSPTVWKRRSTRRGPQPATRTCS